MVPPTLNGFLLSITVKLYSYLFLFSVFKFFFLILNLKKKPFRKHFLNWNYFRLFKGIYINSDDIFRSKNKNTDIKWIPRKHYVPYNITLLRKVKHNISLILTVKWKNTNVYNWGKIWVIYCWFEKKSRFLWIGWEKHHYCNTLLLLFLKRNHLY